MKILLVDDEPATIEFLRSAIDFKEYGFNIVDEANDGDQALPVIGEYDAVITDLKMPKMDGLTMIRRAKEEQKVKTKFIIITAYDDFEFVKTALRYGVRNYILKPINPEEVREELEKLKEEFDSDSAFVAAEVDDGKNKVNSTIIGEVRQYVDKHYADKLSLNILGKIFYVNPVYLGQVFRNRYNLYFNEYVLQVRMERAKRLLETTARRISDIAREVGYQDYDYFSVSFEKYVGMKPMAYRNMTREKGEEE